MVKKNRARCGAEKEFIFPGTEKFALSPIFEGGYMKLCVEGTRGYRPHTPWHSSGGGGGGAEKAEGRCLSVGLNGLHKSIRRRRGVVAAANGEEGVASESLRVAAARNARTRELRFRRQTTAAVDEGRDGGGSIQGNNIRCHGEVCVCCAKRGKRRRRRRFVTYI